MSEMTDNPEIALALARSHFIDAFSTVEAAVIKRLRAIGVEPKARLAQDIRTLKNAKPSSSYSKLTKVSVDRALDDLQDLSALRCDIAHGQLTLVKRNGVSVALFSNPQKSNCFAEQASLITFEQFKKSRAKLTELAATISPD